MADVCLRRVPNGVVVDPRRMTEIAGDRIHSRINGLACSTRNYAVASCG